MSTLPSQYYGIYMLYYKHFTTPTLTDNSSIIIGATDTAVNEVAMSAAEQVCLRASTLDTTHSGRLGGVTK